MNHDRSGGITHDLGFKFANEAALEWRPIAGTGWVTALAVNASDQIVAGSTSLGVVIDGTAGTVGIGDVAGGAVVVEVEADGDVQIGDQTGDIVIDIDDAGNLGFFGETPTVGQQTLTASGDAARLTELLTALDALGLVVDATTPSASDAGDAGLVALAGIAENTTEGWETVGAVYYVPAEHSGVTTARLRALLSTSDSGHAARLRVWDVTHGAQVGAEMTSASETLDTVSAVLPLHTNWAVYAVQLCTTTASNTATASNAWVKLGSADVTVELTTVPASVYAGVAASFGVTVGSGVPWVLDVDGVLYTGTGAGAEQSVSVTVPTGGGARTVDVRLSVGVTEDTDTVAVQEIERLGELCAAMTYEQGSATQSYTGHKGDLYVWVGTYKSNATTERVTGITYGGVSLTKVSAEAPSSDNHIWLHCYRLAAASMPAAGAENIVVDFVYASIDGIALGVIETGGAVSAPDDSQFGSAVNHDNAVVSVTTAAANSVVMGAIICSDDATYTPLSGQTKIGECDPGAYAGMAIGWYQAGAAGSVAASWDPTGIFGSSVIANAVAIRPA
jgi:hypothetical protein